MIGCEKLLWITFLSLVCGLLLGIVIVELWRVMVFLKQSFPLRACMAIANSGIVVITQRLVITWLRYELLYRIG